ncbi:hypothetical protein [Salinibacter sp.]|uniref:hypothetical protein n=1 Tax=Salinibacter sp. TaxID=2065818 RepID=UPI0021E8AFC8|nr:hypothetical protein [Salinibacter sp.]
MRLLSYFVSVILAALLFTGCVSTQGTQVEELEEQSPYRFQYDGGKEEAVQELKRILVPQGWNLRNEDLEAGVISAQKTLREDEKISQTAFGEALTQSMAGVSAENQKGRLSFLLTTEGNVTQVQMTPKLVVVMQENEGFTSSKNEETSTPAQGHPMSVKYGLTLHRTEGFRLMDPNPERLTQAENDGGR